MQKFLVVVNCWVCGSWDLRKQTGMSLISCVAVLSDAHINKIGTNILMVWVHNFQKLFLASFFNFSSPPSFVYGSPLML